MKPATTALLWFITLAGLLLAANAALSDDDHWDDESNLNKLRLHSTGVASVSHPGYKEECGSCHMAYPPGLLPARSWAAIVSGLQDHFGENAELDVSMQSELSQYLLQNSADNSSYRRSRAIMRNLAADVTPLRISEIPYLRHEHDELPRRMVQANPDVSSFSNCNACHRRAEQGSFSEREIRIPGYARWDD